MNRKYLIALTIVLIIVILYFNIVSLYVHFNKQLLYMRNKEFYKLLEQLEYDEITIHDIPYELKDYMICKNIPNIKKDSRFILNEFIKDNKHLQEIQDDLFIYDELDFNGSYFPTAHTDIEWNKVLNDGFQVWSLIKNNNNTGNMFILYNEYLYNKYNGVGIVLRIYKNQIAVIKNCVYFEFSIHSNDDYIYELIPINEFMANTKKYYLNFNEGDSILFAKNVIHISDYRNNTNDRQAYNFRVAIKDKGKINLSESNCGYVLDPNIYKN